MRMVAGRSWLRQIESLRDEQGDCSDRALPCFAPVEDEEHQNGAAIVRVLEGVSAPEGLEQEFAVFLVPLHGKRRRD